MEDEQSFATLKADIGTKVYEIIKTIFLPEIKKEFDEKRNIYSNNYVEIVGGFYDLEASKLDILVTKIPPDYGCNTESCAHRTVTIDLPVELRLSQFRQISIGIAVHQNMGPSDDSGEYDMFVDRVLKKASEEAKVLLSEAVNVLEQNKDMLLEDDAAVEYLLLRQYTDISRVSVLFGSLDLNDSCAPYCSKPLDVVITSNSNYERLWAYESSVRTGEQTEQPTAEMLQECEKTGIEEENCSDAAILAEERLTSRAAIDSEAVDRQNGMIANSFTMIGIGAAIAGLIAFVTLRNKN
jgi:hypothetical protein